MKAQEYCKPLIRLNRCAGRSEPLLNVHTLMWCFLCVLVHYVLASVPHYLSSDTLKECHIQGYGFKMLAKDLSHGKKWAFTHHKQSKLSTRFHSVYKVSENQGQLKAMTGIVLQYISDTKYLNQGWSKFDVGHCSKTLISPHCENIYIRYSSHQF